MKRTTLLIAIIIGGTLFIGGLRLKDQLAASRPNHTAMNLAVFSACNAVKKMEMFPTKESKKEADYAISRIKAVAQTHEDDELANNMTFILTSYEDAIEAFHKEPSQRNLLLLQETEVRTNEIIEIVRPR